LRFRAIAPLLLAAGVVLLGAPAFGGTNAGDTELNISGNTGSTTVKPSGSDSVTVTSTAAFVQVGYFLDKARQIGGSAQALVASSSGTTASETYLEGFFKYHFLNPGKPELVPFVGVYAGSISIKASDSSGSGTTFAVSAELKYFMDENTSVNGEYIVRRATVNYAGSSADVTDSRLFVGLSFYFAGKK
jgi:hypothetical protein